MFEQAIKTVKSTPLFRERYDNWIGGRWVAPLGGAAFTDHSPINGAQTGRDTISDPPRAVAT